MKVLISCRDRRAHAIAAMLDRVATSWRLTGGSKGLEAWNGAEFEATPVIAASDVMASTEIIFAHTGDVDRIRLPELSRLGVPALLFSSAWNGTSEVALNGQEWSAGVVQIAIPISAEQVQTLKRFIPDILEAAKSGSIGDRLKGLNLDFRKPMAIAADLETRLALGNEASAAKLIAAQAVPAETIRRFLMDPRSDEVPKHVQELLASAVDAQEATPPNPALDAREAGHEK